MSTCLDIVSGSLTKIGELGQGQTASPEDGALGLRLLNLILSLLSTQRLTIYTVATKTYALAAGTADYTIGPTGATFTDTRPTFVEGAQVNPFGGTWLPLSILSKPQWDAIQTKNATADKPNDIWPEYTYPNLAFHVNPIQTANMNIRLGCWIPLTQFATLFDTVSFPTGYEKLLQDLLAVDIAPYYDQPVTADLQNSANIALQMIMGLNAKTLTAALDPAQTLQAPNVGQPSLPTQQPAPLQAGPGGPQ
jgi:hypothetical protein